MGFFAEVMEMCFSTVKTGLKKSLPIHEENRTIQSVHISEMCSTDGIQSGANCKGSDSMKSNMLVAFWDI